MSTNEREGFSVRTTPTRLSPQQRVTLLRRGNELFNNGQVEQAKRIFLTLGYSDGIARIGDVYLREHRPVDAIKMYHRAPDPHRLNQLARQMAEVLRTVMGEETTPATDT